MLVSGLSISSDQILLKTKSLCSKDMWSKDMGLCGQNMLSFLHSNVEFVDLYDQSLRKRITKRKWLRPPMGFPPQESNVGYNH